MSANAEDGDPTRTMWSHFLGQDLPYRDKKQLDEKDWCREFLKLYAKNTGTPWRIERKSEKPDFICSDGNRTIGVEISEIVGQPTPDLNIKRIASVRAQLECTLQEKLRQHVSWVLVQGFWLYHILPELCFANKHQEAVVSALAELFWTSPRPCTHNRKGLPPGIGWVWIEERPDRGGPPVTVWVHGLQTDYADMGDFTARLDAILRRHSGSFGSLPDGAEGILVLTADFVSAEGRLFEQAARQWECPQMPGLRECYLLRGHNPDKGYELFPVRVDKRLSRTENGLS